MGDTEVDRVTDVAGLAMPLVAEAAVRAGRAACDQADCCQEVSVAQTSRSASTNNRDEYTQYDVPTVTIDVACSRATEDCQERTVTAARRLFDLFLQASETYYEAKSEASYAAQARRAEVYLPVRQALSGELPQSEISQ